MFSYRQTIKAYPSAGGAYIVTKDNLGLLPAQVAGVALLTDYILTVAVSVSAGVAALYSAVPSVYPYRVPVALGFIAIIACGQPARGQGVGQDLRRPDLPVHHLHVLDDPHRASTRRCSAAACHTWSADRSGRAGGHRRRQRRS